ncbi:WD domain, G-beta repeat [Maioricimonas rarisocia]|uniref:WD domain, G-beta repeat n=1 Tax=Maioricimonas rarisocia TaxID=2528026 RepID=A0A517ZAM3_9PLAN|nr:WD domain, G-beta repeat [Maioricimonas rarisocia]
MPTGREMLTLEAHEGGVGCVRFSPDGSRIVSGGGDRMIRIWGTSPPQTCEKESPGLMARQ